MLISNPEPGEIYESRLYPGLECEVLGVNEAQVTYRWVHTIKYTQVIPVTQFLRDHTARKR